MCGLRKDDKRGPSDVVVSGVLVLKMEARRKDEMERERVRIRVMAVGVW